MFDFIETPNTGAKVIDSITITANEHLSFPTFFVDKHKLKESTTNLHARLYYDRSNNAMAIQFIPDKVDGSYKVNVSPQYGATCKIKAFLLNNDLSPKRLANKYSYKKYAAEELGLSGQDIFVLYLNKPLSGPNHSEESEAQYAPT